MKFKYKKILIKLWRTVYKTIWSFNLHNGIENAGYMSFTLLFTIFPFLIFFMLFVSYFGSTEIGIKLLQVMQENLPKEIAKTIFPVIDNVINAKTGSIISIASITLIWSASSLVQSITAILNRAYRIRKTTSYIKGRIKSILLFLFMVLFIISMIFTTIILPPIMVFIDNIIPINFHIDEIYFLLKPLLLFLFLFIFIEFIYYVMPSVKKMSLKDTIYGSLLAIFSWVMTGKGLSFYWQHIGNNNAVYGSFAGIIITLFFFNIMSMIFIFCAEFNYNLVSIFKEKKKVIK
ncbi:MAG: YihY/virulence factor BrkB family protein [Rickettsiales bacterium]|nr:YihY/virulence factor BrkB family protein [Rickettsiales bacterium]